MNYGVGELVVVVDSIVLPSEVAGVIVAIGVDSAGLVVTVVLLLVVVWGGAVAFGVEWLYDVRLPLTLTLLPMPLPPSLVCASTLTEVTLGSKYCRYHGSV